MYKKVGERELKLFVVKPEGWKVSRDDPPAILFLGSDDKLIPVSVLETFSARMKTVGVVSTLHVYAGQGHGIFNSKSPEYYSLTVIEADKFLASLGWIKGPPTLQPRTETDLLGQPYLWTEAR